MGLAELVPPRFMATKARLWDRGGSPPADAVRPPNTCAKPARLRLTAGVGRMVGLNLIVQAIGALPDPDRILLALAKLDGFRAGVADEAIGRETNHREGAACARSSRAPVR